MTIKESFKQWSALPENVALANKCRIAVNTVLIKKHGDTELSMIDEETARNLFACCDAAQELKAKAASILVHLMQWGSMNKHCQPPSFDCSVSRETLPEGVEIKKEICQLDPQTLAVIKRWPHAHRIHQELGIGNVRRAIERCGIAGGFYWTYSADLDTFAKRLAAHKDHNAQAHADHCAQMREAKKPQITQIDTEEKPKRRKKAAAVSDTVGTVPAVGSDAKERTTEGLSPSVVTPTDEGGKKTKPKSGDNSKTAKVGTKVSVSTTEGQQMGTVPAVTPESSHQGQSPLCPAAAAPGDNRSRASKALEVFTDDELFAELDRRGWHGCFSRTEIVTIGQK